MLFQIICICIIVLSCEVWISLLQVLKPRDVACCPPTAHPAHRFIVLQAQQKAVQEAQKAIGNVYLIGAVRFVPLSKSAFMLQAWKWAARLINCSCGHVQLHSARYVWKYVNATPWSSWKFMSTFFPPICLSDQICSGANMIAFAKRVLSLITLDVEKSSWLGAEWCYNEQVHSLGNGNCGRCFVFGWCLQDVPRQGKEGRLLSASQPWYAITRGLRAHLHWESRKWISVRVTNSVAFKMTAYMQLAHVYVSFSKPINLTPLWLWGVAVLVRLLCELMLYVDQF